MAGIHAPYYTNVQTVLNTSKLIPYLNKGTKKYLPKFPSCRKKPQNRKFQPPAPGYGSVNSKCAQVWWNKTTRKIFFIEYQQLSKWAYFVWTIEKGTMLFLEKWKNAPPLGRGFLTIPHRLDWQGNKCTTNAGGGDGHAWNRLTHYAPPSLLPLVSLWPYLIAFLG